MYELEPGCRAALSARPVVPLVEGLSRESWAENEMRRWETSVWQGVWLTARTSRRRHRVLPRRRVGTWQQ